MLVRPLRRDAWQAIWVRIARRVVHTVSERMASFADQAQQGQEGQVAAATAAACSDQRWHGGAKQPGDGAAAAGADGSGPPGAASLPAAAAASADAEGAGTSSSSCSSATARRAPFPTTTEGKLRRAQELREAGKRYYFDGNYKRRSSASPTRTGRHATSS